LLLHGGIESAGGLILPEFDCLTSAALATFHKGDSGRGRLSELLKGKGSPCQTHKHPDLTIGAEWALELKIVRPFGDNGKEAENWSVNLLHPYRGCVSAIGDAFSLIEIEKEIRKAIVVIGYD